jgi:hypothetical protein
MRVLERLIDAVLIIFVSISLIGLSVMLFVKPDYPKNYKYTIDIPNRLNHYTNHYICNGSCVKFKDSEGDTMTVCGNYSIRSNK